MMRVYWQDTTGLQCRTPAQHFCKSETQVRGRGWCRPGRGNVGACLHEKPMMSTEAGTACVLKLPYSPAIALCR